jgi:drug/metabolite transporter (DMT)-like permease
MSTPVPAEVPVLTSDKRVTSGIVFTIFAGLSFALSGFLANDLVDGGHPGVIVGFYEDLGGLVLVLAINVRQFRGRPQVTRPAMLWIVLAAAGFATAFASFYTALSRIDFSVGAPILGAVPMVSYVVILFILRGDEHITPRALLGAMLVVVGVGIIGITN